MSHPVLLVLSLLISFPAFGKNCAAVHAKAVKDWETEVFPEQQKLAKQFLPLMQPVLDEQNRLHAEVYDLVRYTKGGLTAERARELANSSPLKVRFNPSKNGELCTLDPASGFEICTDTDEMLRVFWKVADLGVFLLKAKRISSRRGGFFLEFSKYPADYEKVLIDAYDFLRDRLAKAGCGGEKHKIHKSNITFHTLDARSAAYMSRHDDPFKELKPSLRLIEEYEKVKSTCRSHFKRSERRTQVRYAREYFVEVVIPHLQTKKYWMNGGETPDLERMSDLYMSDSAEEPVGKFAITGEDDAEIIQYCSFDNICFAARTKNKQVEQVMRLPYRLERLDAEYSYDNPNLELSRIANICEDAHAHGLDRDPNSDNEFTRALATLSCQGPIEWEESILAKEQAERKASKEAYVDAAPQLKEYAAWLMENPKIKRALKKFAVINKDFRERFEHAGFKIEYAYDRPDELEGNIRFYSLDAQYWDALAKAEKSIERVISDTLKSYPRLADLPEVKKHGCYYYADKDECEFDTQAFVFGSEGEGISYLLGFNPADDLHGRVGQLLPLDKFAEVWWEREFSMHEMAISASRNSAGLEVSRWMSHCGELFKKGKAVYTRVYKQAELQIFSSMNSALNLIY